MNNQNSKQYPPLNFVQGRSDKTTLILPSKGTLEKNTLLFLERCGLSVIKTNPRQYTALIPALPQLKVLFQRAEDVVAKVADGSADLGISGYDIVAEYSEKESDLIVVHPHLGYGHCELVVAAPQSWVDLENMVDLHEIALDFREKKKRDLKIATTFPNLTKNFLLNHSITHFTIVEAQGAIEAAPTLGYADIISDITSSGTTLRENHLKLLEDGTILKSQACLIANKNALSKNQRLLETLKAMLELIDSSLSGKEYYQINATLQGKSTEDVASTLLKHPATRGIEGPSVSPVYTMERGKVIQGGWFTATIILEKEKILETVYYFRKAGAVQIIVTPATYIFFNQSETFKNLLHRLKRNSG